MQFGARLSRIVFERTVQVTPPSVVFGIYVQEYSNFPENIYPYFRPEMLCTATKNSIEDHREMLSMYFLCLYFGISYGWYGTKQNYPYQQCLFLNPSVSSAILEAC